MKKIIKIMCKSIKYFMILTFNFRKKVFIMKKYDRMKKRFLIYKRTDKYASKNN